MPAPKNTPNANAEQSNDPKLFHDPGKMTPEELQAYDNEQAALKQETAKIEEEQKRKEAEGGPAETGPDKGDGSQEPALEHNTPKPPTKLSAKDDFRLLLMSTITKEITEGAALLGSGRGNGTVDQQKILFQWTELGVKLSNDDEI